MYVGIAKASPILWLLDDGWCRPVVDSYFEAVIWHCAGGSTVSFASLHLLRNVPRVSH
jgi:hypothetical protein